MRAESDGQLRCPCLHSLQVALEKARARVGASNGFDPDRVAALLAQLERRSTAPLSDRLQARSGNTTRFFDAAEITRIFASGRYAAIVHEGREFLLVDSLRALEKQLGPSGFFRVHRSELVNLAAVSTLQSENGATRVELSDGQTANVSRRSVVALKQKLGIR